MVLFLTLVLPHNSDNYCGESGMFPTGKSFHRLSHDSQYRYPSLKLLSSQVVTRDLGVEFGHFSCVYRLRLHGLVGGTSLPAVAVQYLRCPNKNHHQQNYSLSIKAD